MSRKLLNRSRAEIACLAVNYSKRETFEVIRMLEDAGFDISASPVSGISEPELVLGAETYIGLDEIREAIANYQVSEGNKTENL